MPLASRLFAFAAVLTVALSVYRAVDWWRGKDRQEIVITHVAQQHAPAIAVAPEAPLVAEIPAIPEAPIPAVEEALRIHTRNGAAYLSLRNDMLVAGLSDSIRVAIRKELGKEATGKNFIEKAVLNGVEKLVQRQVEVPLGEVSSIDYRGGRIVIQYRGGKAPGVINLETIKSDEHGALLSQFSEADARRLVEQVRARIVR